MTVSASTTKEIDIKTLIWRAFNLAGLMGELEPADGVQWSARSSMAREFLDMILDGLQAEGIFARHVDRYDVTVIAGTTSYAMPNTTLEIFGDATFIETGETVSTVVTQIPRDRYMVISDKTAQGHPSLYYVEKGQVISVYLWPVPDAAGSLSVQRQRLMSDADDLAATVDMERHWVPYLMWELAHHLATAAGLSEARLSYLNARAKDNLEIARRRSFQSSDFQMIVAHGRR